MPQMLRIQEEWHEDHLHRNRKEPSRTRLLIQASARILLLSTVAATAWAFGGVQVALQQWIFVPILLVSLFWIVDLIVSQNKRYRLPFSFVFLVGGILLAILQISPLPDRLLSFVSADTISLRRELIDDLPDTSPEDSAVSDRNFGSTVSCYPASTRRDLALLVLATTTFLLASHFFRKRREQLALCWVMAINGAALSLFGLVQSLTWNGKLFWRVPLSEGGEPFGPFVNRNNAAGFLNLSLAASIGLILWSVSRMKSTQLVASKNSRAKGAPRLLSAASRFVAELDALNLGSLALAGCIVSGILCSGSRGGVAAMIGGAVLVILLAHSNRNRFGMVWILAGCLSLGVVLMAWVGMTDAVRNRLSTLSDWRIVEDGRLAHWRDAVKAVPDFWPLGSGLGTYRFVYGRYQQRFEESWYFHAENQYLEALLEGGLVGLGLLLAMLASVAYALLFLLKMDLAEGRIFALAASFGLMSQVVQAFVDFGLYIPSNMLFLALICGSIAGRSARLQSMTSGSNRSKNPPIATVAPGIVLAVFMGATSFWAWGETRRMAVCETATKRLRDRMKNVGTAAPRELVLAIERLTEALRYRSDDAQGQLLLAKALILRYRLETFAGLLDERPDTAQKVLWESTEPIALHRSACNLVFNRNEREIEQLRNEPTVIKFLIPAIEHLRISRMSCPLLPETHLDLAALGFVTNDPTKEESIGSEIRTLSPGNPDYLFTAGLLDFQAGRTLRTCSSWRRCLEISSKYEKDILSRCSQRLVIQDMIDLLFPDSPHYLIELAEDRYGNENFHAERTLMMNRAHSLLERTKLPHDEKTYLHARILALSDRFPEAVKKFSQAIDLNPTEIHWRYELALLLRENGEFDQALEHAIQCYSIDPKRGEYRKLLEELNAEKRRRTP